MSEAPSEPEGQDDHSPKDHKTNGEVEGSWDLEGDQEALDADQTASDSDQTASDLDQQASEVDQTQSDADQRASDRDQAASDRDLSTHPEADAASQEAHDASRSDREAGSVERGGAAFLRDVAGSGREDQAAQRDDTARLRDAAADARDLAAETRDRALGKRPREPGSPEVRLEAALDDASSARDLAARARVRAAEDRQRAAKDREQASHDRTRAAVEVRKAHLDELTGAYRRDTGEVAVRHEIERARRSSEPLMLAYVDIDGLKSVNDRDGHAAGDAVLRDVADAIRANLRPYDPLVRMGEDEFICTFSSADLADAQHRFDTIRGSLAVGLGRATREATISVGFVTLGSDETLEELIVRGDAALHEAKRAS